MDIIYELLKKLYLFFLVGAQVTYTDNVYLHGIK